MPRTASKSSTATSSPSPVSTEPVSSASNDSGKPPVHSIRYGNVKASVWLNDSANGPFHTVTVQRSWRDDVGEWHDSLSFNFKDLPSLAKAITDCHSWIAWQEKRAKEQAAAGGKR